MEQKQKGKSKKTKKLNVVTVTSNNAPPIISTLVLLVNP